MPFPLYYHTKKGLHNNILDYPKVPHTYKKTSQTGIYEFVNLKKIDKKMCQNKEFMCQYMKYLQSLKKYSENKNETEKARERLRKKHDKMLKKIQNICFC